MKFLVLEQGSQYFYSIDQAAKMLGVSRRAIFDLVKKVKVEPWDKRQVEQKSFYSEDVLGRIWALQRRYREKDNGGSTGVVVKPRPEKGVAEEKPITPPSKPSKSTLSAEQKEVVQKKTAEMLAKV